MVQRLKNNEYQLVSVRSEGEISGNFQELSGRNLEMSYSFYNCFTDRRQGPSQIISFVWNDRLLQLIVRHVAVIVQQARTDHLGEEPFLPFVVGARVLPNRRGFVPAAVHAAPLGGQACGTNLSPFRPPRRRVCAFVPPRKGHANALRRIDCPLTYSARVLRPFVYLHRCRDLGNL